MIAVPLIALIGTTSASLVLQSQEGNVRTASRGLSMFAPHTHRLRMRSQSLGIRQAFDRGSNLLEPVGGKPLYRNHLRKICHA